MLVCRLVRMTQEVGQVDSERGKINYQEFPIGTILYMYPYRVCTVLLTCLLFSDGPCASFLSQQLPCISIIPISQFRCFRPTGQSAFMLQC